MLGSVAVWAMAAATVLSACGKASNDHAAPSGTSDGDTLGGTTASNNTTAGAQGTTDGAGSDTGTPSGTTAGEGGEAGDDGGGTPSAGGAATTNGSGGSTDASSMATSTGGSGGSTDTSTMTTTTATTGGDGSGFVDEAGDAESDVDVLSGAFYEDGEIIEVRVKFAGQPLSDGATLFVETSTWRIELVRDGQGFSLRRPAAGLGVGLDSCTHVLVDDAGGWLAIRLPAVLMNVTAGATVNIATDPASGSGDSVQSLAWTLLPYPGPLPNAAAACEPWGSARTSTLAFRDISLGNGVGCGVTLSGEVVCWGEEMALTTLGVAASGPFEQVSLSNTPWYQTDLFACGRRSSGAIECWGASAPTVAGDFREMGDPFGCAILESGDLSCIDMGSGEDEIRSASGPIDKVVGAGTQECHLLASGQISCFVDGMAPSGDDFIDVALGTYERACALHADGSLDCDVASTLPYALQSVHAGGRAGASFPVACGLTQEGSAICFGGAGITPPVHPGAFERLEVSSTGEGMCGFRADDTVSCWHYSYVAGSPVPATTPP